jgi:ATP-dependent Lon protease
LKIAIFNLDEPGKLADAIAAHLNMPIEERQALLEETKPRGRLLRLNPLLTRELAILRLGTEIQQKVTDTFTRNQREYFLREQMKTIKKELGEQDQQQSELKDLDEKIARARMPAEIEAAAKKEKERLQSIPSASPEYTVARTYLDWLTELPWAVTTEDKLDIPAARRVLDTDHYDLKPIKERILEYLSVLKLKCDMKGPILCFVGPPGVGKTSLGQSIARALGRKFVRMSLGGMHDEAEIRGHRRTYIGAMPGRIIQAVRRAGVNNPLLMLDEIDKLGRDFRGDPAAALMEILDPAQNKEFRDNYLNLPFDLSKVFFITTANTLEGIPRPLLDRMEVMELTGYSDAEKLEIARRYLIPRQRTETGLKEAQLDIPDDALTTMIRRYTREAGVRELERTIGRLARKRARQVLETKRDEGASLPPITDVSLGELLGPARFQLDKSRVGQPAGVAAGLAWTEAGGDTLYIEAVLTHKDEKVTLTGQLGNVMQESAKAARSYIWSAAESLGIPRKRIEKRGVHIHVPAGAVPKDGPSAGITMATALASAYSGVPVDPNLAMTGELTLTGLVLPIGGVKEKVLAAHRAGLRKIILPKDNEADLAKVPENVRAELEVTFVEKLEEVIAKAIPELKERMQAEED